MGKLSHKHNSSEEEGRQNKKKEGGNQMNSLLRIYTLLGT